MPLVQFELELALRDLEPWSEALLELGALSVGAEDADAGSSEEEALFGEPGEPGAPDAAAAPPAWRRNRVSVLAPEGCDAAGLVEAAARRIARAPVPVLALQVLEDEDWVLRTQAQFPPFTTGRLAIVPTWHEPPPGRVAVRLDPGVAFGTGSHPTTRLCLSWLAREMRPGASLLDYGCGSGILSIAAAALGAGEVIGIDIDPQAVQAATANARRNGVAARYTDASRFPPDGAQRFDIVVANILANPLVVLAPSLARRVAPGGHMVLSGILDRQAAEVIAAYRRAAPSIALSPWARDSGWVALAGPPAG